MVSHQLAIAKASFSAGLLRPDPTSLSREDIACFHSLLNSAIIKCTPTNVQNCKKWILENVVQSTARFTALGKYLTTLSFSFTANGAPLDPLSRREPSAKRKRLHVLYVLNDVLYHAKYRVNDVSICGKLQPVLMSLLGSAASFKESPKHQGKILDLLSLWEENGYYSRDYIDKLRETVKNASELGTFPDDPSESADQKSSQKTAKLTHFVMPAMHGEAATPWYDLPAGNLMPHIIPNSTRPINPDMVKPLQFVAGPADEGLVRAVKELLDDVDKIYCGVAGQDEKTSWDIDELGQLIVVDEISGDVLEGEGYYGWSRTFCEKMKRRRKGLDMPDQNESRGGRRRTRSSSPGGKRQRYSQSDDGSSPAGRRLSRQRRYSSSRSRSRSASPNSRRSRSRSRSYSRSPRRSPRISPIRDNTYQRAPQEHQHGLPQNLPGPFNQPPSFQNGFNRNGEPPPPPPPPPYTVPYNMPPNIPYPGPHQNMPYNMPNNNVNQQQYGSWAPPPPTMNAFANAPWPPPPPPPPPGPPPPHHFQQQQFPPGTGGWQQQVQPNATGQGGWQPPMNPNNGQGYGNGGWNNGPQGRGGRGGRGNYRGRGW